jgi:group II intron reverse transcriptase/maturase
VRIAVETQKERRDAVIQLKLFLQLLGRKSNRRIEMMETKSIPVTKRMVWDAYKIVRSNKGAAGIDKISITKFEEKLADNLYVIWNRMSSGSYFPPAVKRVSIPKANGKLRELGIPTVADRTAQMVMKQYLEPRYEQIFSNNSFGYRPGKSAHQALDQCVHNCRRHGWLIDLDIEGFFDNLQHDKMMEFLEKQVHEKWVKLYVSRWLEASVLVEGKEQGRTKGTPQGGVISPLLANIYLHYAFDEWITKEKGWQSWQRYADDIIVHCVSKGAAEKVLQQIKERLLLFGLKVNEEKTKIVYCRQEYKNEDYEQVSFDFLGYQFKPRKAKNKEGKIFLGYGAGISQKAKKKIRMELRDMQIDRYTPRTIEQIATTLNAKVRGWINYFTRYNKWDISYIMYRINTMLTKWVRRKFKVTSKYKAIAMLKRKQQLCPKLFAHWQAGFNV